MEKPAHRWSANIEAGEGGGSADAAEGLVLRLSRWKEFFKRVPAERAELTPAMSVR